LTETTHPVHEQIETIRWSLFPPGSRYRDDWSLTAVALADGTWSLRGPGFSWLDVDHIWQYGTHIRSRLARLTLGGARRLADEQLPGIVVNGRTAREAYEWAQERGHV
jgi:hypothetical protein